jgi:hypothetical protein
MPYFLPRPETPSRSCLWRPIVTIRSSVGWPSSQAARAVLVQHHALARLALALAPVRATPLGAFDQTRGVQLRLGPGVAPAELMVANQMLVKVLHVPAAITIPVKFQHQPKGRVPEPAWATACPAVGRSGPQARPPRSDRGSAETAAQTCPKARLPPASTARPAPSGSKHPETSASCGPVATLSGSSPPLLRKRSNRTTRVLPNPDNSSAYDTWTQGRRLNA